MVSIVGPLVLDWCGRASAATHNSAVVDWGDVPTWIYTGLTLVIAVGAFWSIAIGLGQRGRRFAELVWALPTTIDTGAGVCTLVVHNGSDSPVYDATVMLDAGGRKEYVHYYLLAPRSSSDADDLDFLTTADWASQNPPPKSLRPPIWVQFTDGSGKRWVREPAGGLRKSRRKEKL